MGILERLKTKKGEEKVSMPKKALKEKSSEAGKAPAKKEAKPKAAAVSAKALPAGLEGIILRPLVTEKASHLAAAGQYVFAVNASANRIDVRSAVKAMYGVVPTSVNIQVVRGKVVRFGRTSGKRKNWKKAIVTLPEGKTIDIYAGV